MKNLLYFEESVDRLDKELRKRKDINLAIIRPVKVLKRYSMTDDDLTDTSLPIYYFDTESNNYEEEIFKLKKWLEHKRIIPQYFLNDSEYYVEVSNRIAHSIGLESLSCEQTKWVRDKVAMKKKFREIGLNTVDFSPIESREELKDKFLANHGKRIIFKPRKGMNSIDTYIIESIEDIDNLDINFKPNKYMIEEFCYDHEWSIESIVQDGTVLDSYVTYIPNPTIWASISNDLNCHMTVPKIPNYFKFKPKEYIQQIVTGMNLKNGAMTIEVFVDNNGNIKASELGWRLPGCQATSNHGLSYGIDIYNLLIDIAIHKKVNLKYQYPIKSVGDLYLPNKEGYISEITSLEDILKMDGAIDGELFTTVGSYQKKRRVGNDASGWVQVEGENEIDTLSKMKNIYNNFIIQTEEERKVKKYVKEKK